MSLRFGLVAVAVAFASVAHAAERPTVRLTNSQHPAVEVVGLSPSDLAMLEKLAPQSDAWSSLFAVHVVPPAGKQTGPAMSGSYTLTGGVLRFEPRFPLAAGVNYRAVYQPGGGQGGAPVVKEFSLPKPKTEATCVTHVYPSSDRLPENQLKFYLHFSAPMARGNVYRHVKLLDEGGKEVDLPFLELDEELWDNRQQRLTLFCDPGRIKRGLKPREENGPVLEEGKRYTLVIDAGVQDANGNALKESFRKVFQALAPDDTQPDPKNWKLRLPPAGTREPLTVTFPKPLDHALLERLLYIANANGKRSAGVTTIDNQETVWKFVPAEPWLSGKYDLVVDTRLEDLAGNSIARPFEVDVFRPVQREVKTEVVRLPFELIAR